MHVPLAEWRYLFATRRLSAPSRAPLGLAARRCARMCWPRRWEAHGSPWKPSRGPPMMPSNLRLGRPPPS